MSPFSTLSLVFLACLLMLLSVIQAAPPGIDHPDFYQLHALEVEKASVPKESSTQAMSHPYGGTNTPPLNPTLTQAQQPHQHQVTSSSSLLSRPRWHIHDMVKTKEMEAAFLERTKARLARLKDDEQRFQEEAQRFQKELEQRIQQAQEEFKRRFGREMATGMEQHE